ncbi:serine/threonine-protein kinase [Myxococcus sp. RHSTA-1-4]|uniref:serine/threonine-protein kinase n=1 Tax=Myxococcus sp. RHSTA-1-4 TaxID=2874601 RepID=UPI001CC06D9F|nr:serine/threonine-protein kinase [Myxococcus sp. RHSTA-1-4]MBZ4416665.1 protein kinase [Myxococcus sp. RHSTA-1-4]
MNEPTAVSDPRIGSVLQERYRIIERLAAGGIGVVYRGERLEVGKPVAIKFLHAWAARDEDFRKRFQVEARAMSRLTHPCCVSVIDFGVDQDSPYMVMDFVTGETLRGLLRDGPLPPARALATIRHVLAGLAHAHAQGIVHRDIKPENIIVTQAVGLGEQVRILDFGIAKLRDEATGLTSGLMLGTPAYMAPEQIHGEPVGPPTDLYATGVLLFELLTGNKPFTASSNAELFHMHREVKPPPLREVAPEAGFTAELEAAVEKALAKAPAERFQSATDFLAALDTVVFAPARIHVAPPGQDAAPGPGADSAPARAHATPSRQEAPEAPRTTDAASAQREEALATEGASAPRNSPSKAQAPAAWAASTEAVAADSPRNVPTERIPLTASGATPTTRGRSPAIMLGGAAALVLLGAGIVWWAAASTSSAPAPATSEAAKRPQAPASRGTATREQPRTGASPREDWRPPPEDLPGLDEVHRLIDAQRRDAALAALKKLAAKHPRSAYVRYLEGNVNFDNLRWVDGVAAYRAALRNDASYRDSPTLIRNAIRCLVSDRFHGICQDFIRKDLGDAAVPYLEEAARADPMANVRTRAAGLLRESR